MSCDVSYLLPSGPTFPTAVPGAVETIVAGTAGAAQTQTAALIRPSSTPTSTPTVTRTPTFTPTSTPTFIVVIAKRTNTAKPGTSTATLVPGSSGEYACRLIDQSPQDGTKFPPKASFDAVWEVRNTGTKTWSDGSVDFVYVSGRKMHEQAVYDLSDTVATGDTIDLIVDMTAPNNPGTYKAEWALKVSGDLFCHVDIQIVVK